MIFQKTLTQPSASLFKHTKLSIYLFLRNENTASELQFANYETLFNNILSNEGGGLIYLPDDSWSTTEMLPWLLNTYPTKNKIRLLWCEGKEERGFEFELEKHEATFKASIEATMVTGFDLISGTSLVSNLSESFSFGVSDVYLLSDRLLATKAMEVDLSQLPTDDKGTIAVYADCKESFFGGCLHYYRDYESGGITLAKRVWSPLFTEKDAHKNEQLLPAKITVQGLKNDKKEDRIRIYLQGDKSFQTHLQLDSVGQLSLKPKGGNGKTEFYYSNVRTEDMGIVDRAFIPSGTLYADLDDATNKLLLNSGASTIELKKGDPICFISHNHNKFDFDRQQLTPLKTSYISVNPEDDSDRTYANGSQNQAMYRSDKSAFLPVQGNASNKAFPILPMLTEDNFQFEKEILEQQRHNELIKGSKAFKPTKEAGGSYLTSKGVKTSYNQGKAVQYRYTREEETESDFTIEVDENDKIVKLIRALERDEIFIVLPPKLLEYKRSKGFFRLSEWEFNFMPEEEIKRKSLLVFKYNNKSFKAAFNKPEGIEIWSNDFLEGLDGDTVAKRIANRLKWREAGSGLVQDDFLNEHPHKELFTNSSWKGMYALDIPMTKESVPPVLAPFIEKVEKEGGEFKADYLAFGFNAIDEQASTKIKSPLCYASINYKAKDDVLISNKDFDFKLLELSAVFTNSKIQKMDCKIKVGAKSFLDKKLDIPAEQYFKEFIILGSYNSKNDTYVFDVEATTVFRFEKSLLEKITLTGAIISYAADTKQTKLDLKGSIDFNLEVAKEFADYLVENVTFQNMGFNFGNGGGFDLWPDFSRTRFSMDLPSIGGGSFLKSFPLKYNSFHYKSAHELGLFKIYGNYDDFKGSIGFLFDLELGTLGALSALKQFKSQVFIGWNAETFDLVVGFKFVGFTSGVNVNLFDVLKIEIDEFAICQFKQNGITYFFIKMIDCKLEILGKGFETLSGAIFVDPQGKKDMGWLLIFEDTSGAFEYLQYLALGQKVGIGPSQDISKLTNVDQVAELVKQNLKDLPCPAPTGTNNIFNPDLEWLIGAHLHFEDIFDLKFVFLDPKLYAMRLTIFKLFRFDAVYAKINDNEGVWHTRLQLSPELRNWDFGAVSITFPTIKFDCFTGGGFKFDLGFPTIRTYYTDYSDSGIAQLGIFIGKGGIYFGSKSNLSVQFCEDLQSVLYGSALRVGLGREVRKGPLSAGASITVYGLFEGLGCFNKIKSEPKDYLPERYRILGRAGVVLEIFGRVDFRIVSASVHLWIEVFSSLLLQTGRPITIVAGGNLVARARIRIKIGFVKITKRFSFKTKIRYTFTIGNPLKFKQLPAGIPREQLEELQNTPLAIPFVYVPRLSVRSNTNEDPIRSIFHQIALLSKPENIDGAWKYQNPIFIDSLADPLPANPLKAIVEKLNESEGIITSYYDNGEDFPFSSLFTFSLIELKAADWQREDQLSRIQFPLVSELEINGAPVTASVTSDYLERLEKQLEDFFIQYEQRENTKKKNKEKEFDSNMLFVELQNDYFQFIYEQAKELNEDLTKLTDADYFQLEGMISYFFESGLRLPHPDVNENTSVPVLQLFENTISTFAEKETFTLSYQGVSSEVTVHRGANKELGDALLKEKEAMKSQLTLIKARKQYDLKAVSSPVNKAGRIEFSGGYFFEFPSMFDYRKATAQLHSGEVKEEDGRVIVEDQQLNTAIAYSSKTLLEFVSEPRIKGDDSNSLVFEILGASSKNSKLMRLLTQYLEEKNDPRKMTFQLYYDSTLFSGASTDFLIFRKNLSKVTHPPIDTKGKRATYDATHAVHFSEDPETFLAILKDATLTNNGGYFIQIKTVSPLDAFKLNFNENNGDKPSLYALLDLESVATDYKKLEFQNVFSVTDAQPLQSNFNEDSETMFFTNIEVWDSNDKAQTLKEYVSLFPPSTFSFELKQKESLDKNLTVDTAYSLQEDYRYLEFEIDRKNFSLSADNTLAIPPQDEEEDGKDPMIYYRHTTPVQDKKPNRYDSVGSEVALACNWRNTLGERLFDESVTIRLTEEARTIKYTDRLVPVSEWPDFGYNIKNRDANKNLDVEFGFALDEIILGFLIQTNTISLDFDDTGAVKKGEFYVVSKKFTLTEEIIAATNEHLLKHFHGNLKNQSFTEEKYDGPVNGVVQQLQLVHDQIEDILERKKSSLDNGRSDSDVRLLIGNQAITSVDVGAKLFGLLTDIIKFVTTNEVLFDSKEIEVTKYFKKETTDSGDSYTYNHMDINVGVRNFKENIKLTKRHFKTYLGSDAFKRCEILLEIKRDKTLAIEEARGNALDPIFNPFAAIVSVNTTFAINEEVMEQFDTANHDDITFGNGMDNEGVLGQWIINAKKVLVPFKQMRQTYSKSKNKKEEFLIRPILNHIWSGEYQVSEHVTETFPEIKMDEALREVLTAIEYYSSPEFLTLTTDATDNQKLSRLLELKEQFSSYLSAQYLYKHIKGSNSTEPDNDENRQAAFKNYLLEDLNNFYLLDGMVALESKRATGVDADYRLYSANPSSNFEKELTFKTGKINKDGTLIGMMDYVRPRPDREIENEGSLFITHIEHNINEQPGIQESNWIRLLSSFEAKYKFTGLNYYSREFPDTPKLDNHDYSYARDERPSELLTGSWDYIQKFRYLPIDGDELTLTLYDPSLNGSGRKKSGLQLNYGGVAYASRVINSSKPEGRSTNHEAILAALVSVPFLETETKLKRPEEAIIKALRFVYDEPQNRWSTDGNWEVVPDGNIGSNYEWKLQNKADTFKIFGTNPVINVDAEGFVIRNKDLGTHFQLETNISEFPNTVTPFLDFLDIRDDDINFQVKKMNGYDVLDRYYQLQGPKKLVVEKMTYQRNGIKHILGPRQMEVINDESPNNTGFERGNYYKVIMYVLIGESYKEIFQIDFIQE